jgi:hypothetical protein
MKDALYSNDEQTHINKVPTTSRQQATSIEYAEYVIEMNKYPNIILARDKI